MKSQEKSKEAESSVTGSSQPMKFFASLFCAICSEDDFDYNLHAAGSLHATQTDMNTDHNHELTIKGKEMAAKVGNSSLPAQFFRTGRPCVKLNLLPPPLLQQHGSKL